MNKQRSYHVSSLAAACVAVLFTLSAQAEPMPPSAAQRLASQCAQCHGTTGNAVGDMDSLAGESFQELYEELLEMKYGIETDELMHYQARGYSDEQLQLIAEYYAGLPRGADSDDDDDDDSNRRRSRDRHHDDD